MASRKDEFEYNETTSFSSSKTSCGERECDRFTRNDHNDPEFIFNSTAALGLLLRQIKLV
jgi:hypothetical protein